MGELGERAEGSLEAFQGNLQAHLPHAPPPPQWDCHLRLTALGNQVPVWPFSQQWGQGLWDFPGCALFFQYSLDGTSFQSPALLSWGEHWGHLCSISKDTTMVSALETSPRLAKFVFCPLLGLRPEGSQG